MEIRSLSSVFGVCRLNAEDVPIIYELCRKNELFYQYHPPFVTQESILEDMKALPPQKSDEDKYYIGFFEKDTLVAVMDLILDYPEEKIAYIGFFMMNMEYQHQGIGTKIIKECAENLYRIGFQKIRLGVDRENPQSNAFWKKNGFKTVGEGNYITMELNLEEKDF